jgi:molybdopterin-guanine dinucleotide biosynthesis protein A
MGTDKALLAVDGEALAARALGALHAAGAGEVLSVGGDHGALRALGFDARRDEWPGEGPLGGLVSGLCAARLPLVVVLACDLPWISGDVITSLVRALDGSSAGAAVPVVGGRRQFLAAAYRRTAEPVLRASLGRGERAVRGALDGIEVVEIVWTDDPRPFTDVDTPADLRGLAGEALP